MLSTKFRHALLWCSVSVAALVSGQAQAQTYSFDIPAESLSASLHEYARVSGQQIIFTNDLVAGLHQPPATWDLRSRRGTVRSFSREQAWSPSIRLPAR